jgi:hypothetical protein
MFCLNVSKCGHRMLGCPFIVEKHIPFISEKQIRFPPVIFSMAFFSGL